jgi:hypothetical protein
MVYAKQAELYAPVHQKTYQDIKNEKKQEIVRNEFEGTGKYGIPLVKKQDIDLKKIKPWCFTKAKSDDKENFHKTIHFFTYDWLFKSVYDNPEQTFEKLRRYYALLTPDFSTYTDMPLALQINSTFKNRWCGAYWQKHGIKVIPTMNWSTPESYEYCFDGVEKGAVVAVSTYCMEEYENSFMPGYNKMLEVIRPTAVVCYGKPFKGMSGNIIELNPYDEFSVRQGEGK